ncbi:TCR/Tet family MFS transporter [Salibacteraceae bacterium]|nr:TCR/Tet family MFS transporter [Salibacteraceae bacterium]MDB4105590.1 TCR/Tet family MFS transporter [Salibacteraceae bacterium]MDB9709874.1 TCR/Tet family MFS transporter [Salibacteraceae bacterium]MDC1220241.1 TCR/Tet family MFS transporter [bacterium]MDC1304263.1 TCR/Tet family MFS transporter [Salibacteraceae bacterium]
MRNKKAAVGFIFITLLLDVTGIGIIIPVMPSLIMELTGEGLSAASKYGGWLIFAYSFFQFIFSPIVGALSDKFGRRPVLLVSLFGFGLDYILLALAPDLWWLFVGRVISGIMGASFTTGAAYIADVSPPEKRAANFGLIGAAFGLGFIVGPVIGGLLGEFGPRVPFYAAAVLSLLNWLYGFLILPESLPLDKRREFSWKRANPIGSLVNLKRYPVLAGLIFAMFFVYIASHAVQSTWAYFTMYRFDWGEAEVGYSLGFVGVLSALVQGLLIRWLIPKIGQNAAVYIGMILYAFGLVLFSMAGEGWMVYPYMVVYCLGGIAGPALQGIMSNQVPSNEQGELQGALTSMMSLTSIIGPPVMTGLFAFFTGPEAPIELPGAPMMLGAALVLIGLFLSWRVLSKMK